ncbi:MAG: LytTR family transcriptional regulator [Bacillati bacterium ANGP1]|uniref:LytTR family transcriptional regulator n=1 Tax=Candidatus Segetimicrobium genomatis TaxID=2569760 RepID=A0A537LCX9_9BACT|nr:MAG: LytTR family transcriptional regulator [Terrabacteria group bacterium ANGP1]
MVTPEAVSPMPQAASKRLSDLLVLWSSGPPAEGVAEPGAGAEPALDRLPVRLDGEIRLLPIRDVIYCYADGDRTMLVTRTGELRSHLSLSRLAERLEPFRFFRCHRAYLVNLGNVCSVIPWTRNAFSLTLEGGKEVPLSKHRVGELRKLLNW